MARVGQPYRPVRGPWPIVVPRGLGLEVIDGRPERNLAAAELRRTVSLRRPEVAEPVARADAVACNAEWVERLDPRIPNNARELGTDYRRAGWSVRYSVAG